MTTIRLNTCLVIPGHGGRDFELPPDTETIADLLRTIGRQIDFDLLEGAELADQVEVLVNGKGGLFCAQGLATPLAPDDDVEIHFIPLGGG
ncbi:MAG TPA: hypothetical protein QF861_05785 [Alphaproteobacteria bacterium]|nr:hypothetical protein [Alphaproteobacteria bacterium]